MLMLLSTPWDRLHAQESGPDEFEIRAAMVYNLTRFIDWPSWKSVAPGANFSVCLLGADSSATRIQTLMNGKTVTGRPVTVHRLNKNEDGTTCHIIYVAHSERKRFEEIAPSLTKAAVLTVGDQDWFATEGGIIGLPLIDNRIQIEINLASAQNSSLNVSSKLLRLATVVK
jgi:hypothetical protein